MVVASNRLSVSEFFMPLPKTVYIGQPMVQKTSQLAILIYEVATLRLNINVSGNTRIFMSIPQQSSVQNQTKTN